LEEPGVVGRREHHNTILRDALKGVKPRRAIIVARRRAEIIWDAVGFPPPVQDTYALSVHFRVGTGILVNHTNAIWRYAEVYGRCAGVDKHVGVDPNHPVIAPDGRVARHEQLLPGRAPRPSASGIIERCIEHQEVITVPRGISLPVPATGDLPGRTISLPKSQRDDGGARRHGN
jgi:hypothetical protein